MSLKKRTALPTNTTSPVPPESVNYRIEAVQSFREAFEKICAKAYHAAFSPMCSMQILIDAGRFEGIIDTETDKYPSNLKFMRGWSMEDIEEYCKRKQWKMTILKEPVTYHDYGGC